MNIFRPLVKKQMHVFNVEGTILALMKRYTPFIASSRMVFNKLEYTK